MYLVGNVKNVIIFGLEIHLLNLIIAQNVHHYYGKKWWGHWDLNPDQRISST